jgi:hypothetical protein
MIIHYTIFDRPGQHEHVASWRGRCTYCGHRVGPNVRQTRERPWPLLVVVIPWEMVMRYRAMRHAGKMPDPIGLIFGPAIIDMTGYHPPTVTLEDADTVEQPAITARRAELIGTLRAVDQALFAYEASVETYGDRLTHPSDFADPTIQTDDTLTTIPAIREVEYVDDGLGDEFEAELEQYERGRD